MSIYKPYGYIGITKKMLICIWTWTTSYRQNRCRLTKQYVGSTNILDMDNQLSPLSTCELHIELGIYFFLTLIVLVIILNSLLMTSFCIWFFFSDVEACLQQNLCYRMHDLVYGILTSTQEQLTYLCVSWSVMIFLISTQNQLTYLCVSWSVMTSAKKSYIQMIHKYEF